jgi:hypothetical protein
MSDEITKHVCAKGVLCSSFARTRGQQATSNCTYNVNADTGTSPDEYPDGPRVGPAKVYLCITEDISPRYMCEICGRWSVDTWIQIKTWLETEQLHFCRPCVPIAASEFSGNTMRYLFSVVSKRGKEKLEKGCSEDDETLITDFFPKRNHIRQSYAYMLPGSLFDNPHRIFIARGCSPQRTTYNKNRSNSYFKE